MIARVLFILGGLYVVLVCIGVGIVTMLQGQIGFIPALGAAVALFALVAFLIVRVLTRRLARLTQNMGGAFEILRQMRRP